MRKIQKHPILVATIAFSKGALFTVLRQDEPREGFPQLPEGSLKRGELPDAAAVRVLAEASGLTATQVQFLGLHTSLERISNTRCFVLAYLVRNWIGEIPLDRGRWISNWREEPMALEDHAVMLMEADSVLQTAQISRSLYAIA